MSIAVAAPFNIDLFSILMFSRPLKDQMLHSKHYCQHHKATESSQCFPLLSFEVMSSSFGYSKSSSLKLSNCSHVKLNLFALMLS